MINGLQRLTMLVLLSLALAACTDPATPTDPEIDSPEPPVSEQPPVFPAPQEIEAEPEYAFEETWVGDLDAMKERRLIRVLTVYSVGRYFLDGGQERGLTKEVIERFEAFINKQYKLRNIKIHVVITPVARNQLIPALLDGRGDIIHAGLSITPERSQLLDFSIPSTKPFQEILVTGPSAPEIDTIDDLAGQVVYVRHSSSYRESLEKLSERFLQEGKEPVIIEPVSELLEDDDLIEMVNAGLLPWLVVDSYKVQLWKGVFTHLVPRHDIALRPSGRIAWAFRKDSPLLAKAVNSFLKKNREGTLVGNILKKRYITEFDWASNALAQDEYDRFRSLNDIFLRYGEQFKLDYLMAAAQGYQESRLDQSARSASGAVGVMQLLPSTAGDPNVGISNIHQVENNIHAGMKYLSYLRNRYFSDPEIDELNKTFLALAAYNVGPRRMINLRNKAAKLGYDPNVWFDNVEIVAARDIGREPVQYVANIYKYYIAYSLSFEQMARRSAARERAGMK
jgi:membrane-bound lytic murein transglycosylase MltF